MYRRSQPDNLASFLLRGHEQDDGVCLNFLAEAVKRFDEDEQYPWVFAEAIHALSIKLADLSMDGDYKPYVNVSSPRPLGVGDEGKKRTRPEYANEAPGPTEQKERWKDIGAKSNLGQEC